MTEPTTPDRPVIRPGDLLNVYEFQEVRHEFAAGAGLRPDQVLMTPYGYPPLPRPPVGAPDGTGRLPAGLALEFAGHPVFWLDDATKRQRPDECDDAFAIRLFLELVDRGYLREEDGWLRNPLVAHGLDVRDPVHRDRLSRYQEGEWDALLCDLAIPPNPDTEPGAIAAAAAEAHSEHEAAYAELISVYRELVRAALADARDTVRAADFVPESQRLVSAGEALRAAAAVGEEPRPHRSALDDAYRWLLARMAQIDDARTVLLVEIDRRTNLDAPRGAAAYADAVRHAHAARCRALEPYMAAVYAAPTDELRLRALLVAIRDGYHEALAAARVTLARAERVLGDELDVGER
jgi:hypothetical protein